MSGAWRCVQVRWRARFAVGIRSAEIDRAAGTMRYGVGSGVVWDSAPHAEYDECLAKALAATSLRIHGRVGDAQDLGASRCRSYEHPQSSGFHDQHCQCR